MEFNPSFPNQTNKSEFEIPSSTKPNIYKPLFFTFFIFFIITASSLITLSISKNKNTPQSQSIPTTSPTLVPTIANEQQTNLLKISDIQMELPQNWQVISVLKNSAKILTDYQKYQVYLNLNLRKNDTVAESSYKSKTNSIQTTYGEVFDVSCGGPTGCTGALIKGNKYSFEWNIESNQPSPENLDGIWVPESDVTPEILLNITKTIKPISAEINETQNWQTYTNSVYKFSIQYPKDWILSQTKDGSISLSSTERNNIIKQQPIAGPEIRITAYDSFSKLPGYSDSDFSSKNSRSLEEYIKGQLSDIEKININGILGFSGYDQYPSHAIYLQKGNIIINITEDSIEKSQYQNSPAQQIINTIKFN